MKFDGDLKIKLAFDGELNTQQSMDGEFGNYIKVQTGETYTGETTVTPSEDVQILETLGKIVPDNITINPIPQNYGLITVIGSHIMVS